MSLIAEFTVEADDFALSDALTAAPEMVVEVEEVVATQEDRVMPYFWVSGGDQSAFEAALNDDVSVRNVTQVDELENAVLYRAEWTENIQTVVYAYVTIGATILQATGQDDRWELKMRFDDHDKLADFREYCDDNDVSFELVRLSEQDQPMASTQYGLTPKQRETLVAARDAGYYSVPQKVTMRELAEDLGVSQQALSKRLHHGHHNLVTSTLSVGQPDE
ncbi:MULTISPECIES: bacterio-opsin activator domain-containing protein [Halorussus]|uniref:helix-turn-helix domain-containing protein n=1 Tax=Halorussus TaxID=1070314 RepID=UPI0020A05BF1|nr:bacterio-opsin activator domain-containing protein [Halorussus vallis]USZ77913.1 helix-turn-helix domain-containing protein [Halorussus vallis]